jgi:hypothetical protein
VEVHSEFVADAAPDVVWDLLLDVERVAPCMPGAELTETIDDRNWKGRVRVRIGPVLMKFNGRVEMIERDDAAHLVRMRGEGAEESGKGNAKALISSQVQPADNGGSRVTITQDIEMSGKVAQFGARMIQDVATLLTKQFAQALNDELKNGAPVAAAVVNGDDPAAASARPAEVTPTAATRAQPKKRRNDVPGIRIAFYALFKAIGRWLHLPWWGRRAKQTG